MPLSDVSDQLWWRHNVKSENTIFGDNGEMSDRRLLLVDLCVHGITRQIWGLIDATGLIILLKRDSNRRFIIEFDLEIWWMTSQKDRAPLQYYIKLCAPFQIHLWIGVRVRKRSIRVKIGDFCPMRVWNLTLKNKSSPQLCCFKLCVSFHSHQWIQTGVTVRKRQIGVTIDDLYVLCDLEIWEMTPQNNRAPLLCYFKRCASFSSHWWIQSGVTVRKHPIWAKSTIL